jgi:hypothetical protein
MPEQKNDINTFKIGLHLPPCLRLGLLVLSVNKNYITKTKEESQETAQGIAKNGRITTIYSSIHTLSFASLASISSVFRNIANSSSSAASAFAAKVFFVLSRYSALQYFVQKSFSDNFFGYIYMRDEGKTNLNENTNPLYTDTDILRN